MKGTRFVEHLSLAAALNRSKVDREKGVINDVKFLGFESLNDRDYQDIDPAIFNGRKSRINHYMKEGDKDPPIPQVENVWAFVENAVLAKDGVYGSLKYNPKHPMIEQILWWAENKPDAMGMSPIMYGTQKKIGSRTVRTPEFVESVDLVDQPATTSGFFESRKETAMDEDFKKALAELASANANIGTLKVQIESLTTGLAAEKAARIAAEDKAKAAEAEKVAMLEAAKQAVIASGRDKLLVDAGFKLDDKESGAFIEAVRTAKDDTFAAALIATAKGGRTQIVSSRQAHPALGAGQKPQIESLEQAEAAGLLKV